MKKALPILIVLAIIIIIILLTASKPSSDVVTTESGEQIKAGIVANDQRQIDPPSLELEVGPSDAEEGSLPELGSGSDEEIQNLVQNDDSVEVGISVGDRAPNFVLEDFDGGVVELASLDKPVVIDFWAGWCPFCIEELPELEAVSQELGDEVLFLGIHRSETESIERGAGFAEERGVTYPLLKDSTGEVYKVYSGGQRAMPVAYFIDADGIIVERKLGPKTAEQIRETVSKLLAAE